MYVSTQWHAGNKETLNQT